MSVERRRQVSSSAAEPARVVTIQALQVAPEDADTFRAHFRRLNVLHLAAEAAGDALRDAVVLQDENRFVVVAMWSSTVGIDAWIASPSRDLVQAELEPYYVAPPVVSRYQLVEQFSSPDAPAVEGA